MFACIRVNSLLNWSLTILFSIIFTYAYFPCSLLFFYRLHWWYDRSAIFNYGYRMMYFGRGREACRNSDCSSTFSDMAVSTEVVSDHLSGSEVLFFLFVFMLFLSWRLIVDIKFSMVTWMKRLFSNFFLPRRGSTSSFALLSTNKLSNLEMDGHHSSALSPFLKAVKQEGTNWECSYTSPPRFWLFCLCLVVPKPPYMTVFSPHCKWCYLRQWLDVKYSNLGSG